MEEEEKRYLAVWFYKELHGMMPTSVIAYFGFDRCHLHHVIQEHCRTLPLLFFLGSALSIPIIPTFFSLYTQYQPVRTPPSALIAVYVTHPIVQLNTG